MIDRALYSRKRKDRWWRFNILTTAFLEAQLKGQTTSAQNRALSWAFRRLGYGKVPEDLQPFWHGLVALGAVRKPSLEPDDTEVIGALASELDPKLLPALGWFDLYRLCMGIGFFPPGELLRGHGLAQMTQAAGDRSANVQQIIGGCYAAVERESFDDARALLRRLEKSGCPDDRYSQASWYVELLAGNRYPATFGLAGSAASADRNFGDFLRDRRVALVGPVPSKVVQGPEIDSHDVVVKFNYRGGEKGRDPSTQGRRLDVSYYNNAQAQTLAGSDFGKVLPEIQWGVFINRKGRAYFPADYPGLRQLISLKWMIPDTHLNAGPNAIIDLLRFCPAGVRVFNTDLMLSAGRFSGYTPTGASPVNYIRSFIKTHDPILQYQVMRRLWKVGYVTGDLRFEEVMSMGLSRYLEQLQHVHGAKDRALI